MSIEGQKMARMIKIRKTEAEEHISTDRYLITYADLITLLLGLFVILYVTAQVDEGKYKEFSKAFSDYFKSSREQILQGGGGVMEGHKQSIPEPIFQNPAKQSLESIKTQTEESLKKFIDKKLISVKSTSEGLVLTFSEKLLFKSGNAEIERDAYPALDSLASVLAGIDKQIKVDGHTDAKPIKTFRFESNWHLSSARALSIGYRLISKGVSENNLMIRAFGSQRPIADNDSEEGKATNRRVEITISELENGAPSKNGFTSENK